MEKVNVNGYGENENENDDILITPAGFACGLLCTGGFLCF